MPLASESHLTPNGLLHYDDPLCNFHFKKLYARYGNGLMNPSGPPLAPAALRRSSAAAPAALSQEHYTSTAASRSAPGQQAVGGLQKGRQWPNEHGDDGTLCVRVP